MLKLCYLFIFFKAETLQIVLFVFQLKLYRKVGCVLFFLIIFLGCIKEYKIYV